MNKKYKRFNGITFLIAAFAILALTIGCTDPVEQSQPDTGENGYLTISIDGAGRTILPINANLSASSYTLVLSAPFKDSRTETWNGSGSKQVSLSPGTWSLVITGKNNNNDTIVRGSRDLIVITPGQTTTETILLQPVVDMEGTGTFTWNIDYPSGVTGAYMIITPLDSEFQLDSENQSTYCFTGYDNWDVNRVSKSNNNSPLELQSGYYKVEFFITGSDENSVSHNIGRVDYLHIYPSLDSYFGYNFTFGPTNYIISYNLNGGSGTQPSSQTVREGNSVTLASGSGLSRTEYAFGGWNTNAAGTGTNYNASSTFFPTGSITLYAKWIQGVIFSENFESTNSFTLVNGSQTNKWYVGTSTYYGGSRSAYISSDSSTYGYNNGSSSTVHMYKDVQFPQSSSPYTLTFYWRGTAESGYDFLTVHLVDTSTTISAGTTPSGSFGTNYVGNSNWTQATISIPASNSGTTKRLVFTWRNDSSVGSQPIAVDNIELRLNN
ncbi:MAG: InlB B-repeat-containing protein [Treponema sp.]|nr:InlB B-repeat-containing protein [Treponema sp.]